MSSFVGAWKGKTSQEVWGWYMRLADFTAETSKKAGVNDPMSSLFLKHYLQGKGKELTFTAPEHLKTSKYIESALLFHRRVYLSQEKLNGNIAGIIPRLKKAKLGAGPNSSVTFTMRLHKLKEIPVTQFLKDREVVLIIAGADPPDDMYERVHKKLSSGDADIFTSLRAFQVESKVTTQVTRVNASSVKVAFLTFLAHVWDTYDFDGNKRLKLPNPDYQNHFKVKNPIAEKTQMIMTHHSNLKQLVQEKKAHPFELKSNPWNVLNPKIIEKATLTI